MMAVGRANLRLLVLAAHGLGNTIGFLLAVRHGIVAVAAAYTIRAYLLSPLDTLVNRRLGAVSVRGLMRAIHAQAIAAAVMGASLWYAKHRLFADLDDILRLLTCATLGLIVYTGTALLVDRSLWKDAFDLARHLLPRHRQTRTAETR